MSRNTQIIEKDFGCLLFSKNSVYRYIIVSPLLKCATVYTLCISTLFLFYWKFWRLLIFIFGVTRHAR